MRGSCAAATAGRVRRLAIRDLYTALSRQCCGSVDRTRAWRRTTCRLWGARWPRVLPMIAQRSALAPAPARLSDLVDADRARAARRARWRRVAAPRPRPRPAVIELPLLARSTVRSDQPGMERGRRVGDARIGAGADVLAAVGERVERGVAERPLAGTGAPQEPVVGELLEGATPAVPRRCSSCLRAAVLDRSPNRPVPLPQVARSRSAIHMSAATRCQWILLRSPRRAIDTG
jgi:hypothetical protein